MIDSKRQERLKQRQEARDVRWRVQVDRLREAIDRAGTTPTTLARELGIGHKTYFRDLLNGKKKSLDAAVMARAADHLGVNARWLSGLDELRGEHFAAEKTTAPQHRMIPLRGVATGGLDGRLVFNDDILDEYPMPPQLERVKNPYAVMVSGESMTPRYKAGEVVYVNPSRAPRRGDDVVVQVVVEGELHGYVKELVQITEDKVVLLQLNPPKKLSFALADVRGVHVIVLASR